MKLTTTFLTLLLGTLTIHQASADSLRCDTRLVDVGDSEDELLDKCGEPSTRDGSMWTYERSGKLKMIVRVGERAIQSIHTESSEKP